MTTDVGIDVGKRQHKALLLDAAGATLQKAFRVNNDRVGMEGLLQRLRGFLERGILRGERGKNGR